AAAVQQTPAGRPDPPRPGVATVVQAIFDRARAFALAGDDVIDGVVDALPVAVVDEPEESAVIQTRARGEAKDCVATIIHGERPRADVDLPDAYSGGGQRDAKAFTGLFERAVCLLGVETGAGF